MAFLIVYIAFIKTLGGFNLLYVCMGRLCHCRRVSDEDPNVTTLVDQASSAWLQIRLSLATRMVLACSHRRSLRLLCTVGGNQAKLDARSEFKFLHIAVPFSKVLRKSN